MKDLRDAIKTLIENSWEESQYYGEGVWDNWYGVKTQHLKNLIAEYNIHFVEPEDPQLKL